jgi:hypothetical protein
MIPGVLAIQPATATHVAPEAAAKQMLTALQNSGFAALIAAPIALHTKLVVASVALQVPCGCVQPMVEQSIVAPMTDWLVEVPPTMVGDWNVPFVY